MLREPTQKAKLSLKALDLALTAIKNDFYLKPNLQKCLTMDDIAREVAAMSTRQEDVEEIARTGNSILRTIIWFLSAGYSISTILGYFHVTAKGVLLEGELNSAPDRDRLKLGISYAMSEEMRKALEEVEIDVEIQRSVGGPQLFAVVSAQDAQNPAAAARGEGSPITAGETCIIRGRNIKVGGTAEDMGVTITRQDGDSKETFFFPVQKLYPNTKTQVGFVMPATAANGSVWSVSLKTQISSNVTVPLKEPRMATMSDNFVVGEVSETPGGDGGGDDVLE